MSLQAVGAGKSEEDERRFDRLEAQAVISNRDPRIKRSLTAIRILPLEIEPIIPVWCQAPIT